MPAKQTLAMALNLSMPSLPLLKTGRISHWPCWLRSDDAVDNDEPVSATGPRYQYCLTSRVLGSSSGRTTGWVFELGLASSASGVAVMVVVPAVVVVAPLTVVVVAPLTVVEVDEPVDVVDEAAVSRACTEVVAVSPAPRVFWLVEVDPAVVVVVAAGLAVVVVAPLTVVVVAPLTVVVVAPWPSWSWS